MNAGRWRRGTVHKGVSHKSPRAGNIVVDACVGDRSVATTAAPAPSPRNPGGRPNGAERFAFKLDDGEGKVCMATRCHPSGGTVLLSLPAAVRSELLAATDERYHTAAIVGLAAWGLRELRRRKRNLTIIDADA